MITGENKIAIIREKLEVYSKAYISSEKLSRLLEKFAPNYSISQLCNYGLISPIKRGKWYMNKRSRDFINPYIVGSLYMWDDLYMYGWMSVYNSYWISEQISEKYTIYNTKISGEKTIWNIPFIFKRQRASFFYGILDKEINGDIYKVMSPERAYIQALKEKKRFQELPINIDKDKLLALANNNASKTIITTIKRLCI